MAQALGLLHQRHNKEMVYFVECDQRKVDNLYLRKRMIYEVVIAAWDGSHKWHKGLEGDVEERHSGVGYSGMERGCSIRWLP